ncbi:MAG: hypothetical protein COW08_10050, partial [Ignavibacteriales bacterium CG12_big_fil_rev_8_21_14_0_65_30_8]
MKKLLKAFTFISILILTTNIYSQGIPDVLRLGEPGLGIGARALGMGNSYIGLSDDASAMFFNPAGLGLMNRIEISGGLNYDNLKNDVT